MRIPDHNLNPDSGAFKVPEQILIIQSKDGNAEIIEETVQANIPITQDTVDPKLLESIKVSILEGLQSGSIRRKGLKIPLPFVNSGGGTCNSILNICLLPPYNDQGERLYIILERDEDESAGTVSARSIPYTGKIDDELMDTITRKLNKILTTDANLLAIRAGRREAYGHHVARKNIQDGDG